MKKHLFSLFVLTLVLGLTTPTVFAAESDCKSLYGGGATKEQACEGKKLAVPTSKEAAKVTPKPAKPSPTPQKAEPTPTKTVPEEGATTKGGLPVLSPTPAKTTPSTGPEMIGLLALAPAAALGFYLRKKE